MDRNDAQGQQREGSIPDRDHYYKMRDLGSYERIKGLPYVGVNKEHLELVSCVKLDNIDVDNVDAHRGGAGDATFFQPSGPIDDVLAEVLSEHWYNLRPGQAARLYPEYRATWFTLPWEDADPLESDDLAIDRFGGTAWKCISDRWYVAEISDLKLPNGVINRRFTHQYFSDFAFFPKDASKPHLACILSDTFISPDKMLRSEVHGAVAMIKYQLNTWNQDLFGDHHTKPVMLYTFQSDQYARITQAYFDRDMGKVVLRQSRQFDLRGPKPTDDAWLLLRWMLNTPVGDTLVKQEDLGLPIRVQESVKPAHVTATSPSGSIRSI